MLSVLRRVGTHREEDHVSLQDKEPRQDSSHQKLGDAWNGGMDSPSEFREGIKDDRHLDFRFLVSRTVRGQISVVLRHQICGHF